MLVFSIALGGVAAVVAMLPAGETKKVAAAVVSALFVGVVIPSLIAGIAAGR